MRRRESEPADKETPALPAARPDSPSRLRPGLLALAEPLQRGRSLLLGAIPFVLGLTVWLGLTETGLVSPIFLPGLPTIGSALWRAFANEKMLLDVGHSVFRIMAGFLLATAVAVPLGLVAGASRHAEAIVEPAMDFVRYLPVPAFIPVCILWFGLGDLQKVVLIFIGTFFSLVLMVASEVARVPRAYLEASYTLGASRVEILTGILLRAASPGIVDCLRITIGWAWTYLIVAELVGATSGVGYAIIKAQRYMIVDTIFAAMVVIGLLGVTTDLLFRGLYRALFPWSEKR